MVIFPKSVKSLEDQTLRHFSKATKFFSKLSFVEASESHEKETAQTNTLPGPVYVEKVYRLGILYFEDWTGLVKRGLVKGRLVKRGLVKRGLTIGSCGRLFFQIFSAFANRIKLNGEQTVTKTNLRLKILFIYFQAVLFRRFSERNNPCLTFQLHKWFICSSYKPFKKFWLRRNLFITSS